MTEAPSPYSTGNPRLQYAFDSTSLQAVMFCPRSYEYTQLEGWQTPSNDLTFGLFAAKAFELYQKARIAGKSRDEAQFEVVRYLMDATWPEDDPHPYGGQVMELWHCTGTEKYRNSKGNAAKCPYSHKGKWFPSPAPGMCGECGSEVEEDIQYVPNHSAKNRKTLVRLLIWYIEEQPEVFTEGLHAYSFPDGTPAVELEGVLPLPWETPYGETYMWTYHFDYIGKIGADLFIVDNKTTTKGLSKSFWAGYNPHLQVDTYDLIGSVMFPELNLRGTMLDAAQTLESGANFGRHPYYKTEAQREEHWKTLEFWIKQAEAYAEAGYWPMNKRNCWLCAFKDICSKDPAQREGLLKANFTKRETPWNPLQSREPSA
jgi:hypothetical protein